MKYRDDIYRMIDSASSFFLIENDGSIYENLKSCLSEKYGIIDFENDMDVRIYESQNLQISDIKRIIFEIGLRPYGDAKLIIFRNFEKVGELSQNALLKSIEELPDDTRIFSICSSTVNILDTIRSRAYYLYTGNAANVSETYMQYTDSGKIREISEDDIFKIMESSMEKDDVLELLKSSMSSMNDSIRTSLSNDMYMAGLIRRMNWMQECYNYISANCNKNLCIDLLMYKILEEK